MRDSEGLAAAVLAAGGRGCMLKAAAVRSAVPAIETAAAHRPYFAADASDARRRVFRRASTGAAPLRAASTW